MVRRLVMFVILVIAAISGVAAAQDGTRPGPFSAVVSPGEQMDLFIAHPALLAFVVALALVTIVLAVYTIRRALAEARSERRR